MTTAGDRYALAGARIESSQVNAARGADALQDWAPRHGFHATPGLVGVVQSRDAETRKLGLWTLASLPFTQADARIVAVVKALSSDPDVDVRRAAVEAAQFTADPGDEPALAALADRMLVDVDFSVRRSAAEGIRKLVLDRHTFLGNACRVLEPNLDQVWPPPPRRPSVPPPPRAGPSRSGRGSALAPPPPPRRRVSQAVLLLGGVRVQRWPTCAGGLTAPWAGV